jgi:hypothetical protein
MPIVQLDPSLINSGGVNAFQNAFTNALKMRASQQELDDNQYKIDSLKQDRAQQNAMAQMLANPEFDPRTAQGQAQLYGVGGVKNTQSYLKGMGDLAKTDSETAKHTVEAKKISAEVVDKKSANFQNLLNTVQTPQQAAQWLKGAYSDPDLAPMLGSVSTYEEAVSRIGQDPQSFATWKQQAGLTASKLADVLHEQVVAAETSRHNLSTEKNQQETLKETNRFNLSTEKNREATLTQNAGKGQYDAERGMMISPQGVATPVMNNGVPLGGKDAKPTAEYLKQAEAYQNMDDALSGYKKVLSGFDTMSMMNPTKRAEMGTAYQNTLLQAKEIYRLGVLNGPDKQILEAIINNPLDVKSIIIPKDALMKQADDLQAIIKRGNDNLAKVNKQPQLSLNSQANKATSSQDSAAMNWAKANPNDPRAAKILQHLGQ